MRIKRKRKFLFSFAFLCVWGGLATLANFVSSPILHLIEKCYRAHYDSCKDAYAVSAVKFIKYLTKYSFGNRNALPYCICIKTLKNIGRFYNVPHTSKIQRMITTFAFSG